MNTLFAAIWSGGSSVSWSVTFAARIVTVHSSFGAKLVAGSSVNVTGPPLAVAVCAPLEAQLIANQLPVTLTGSLKPIVTLESIDAPTLPCGRRRAS